VKGWILHHGGRLGPNERLTMLILADHVSDDSPDPYPSLTTIAGLAGFSERTARAVVRGLERLGYLKIKEGSLLGARRSNTYTLVNADGSKCPGGSRCECDPDSDPGTTSADLAEVEAATSADPAEVGARDLGRFCKRPRQDSQATSAGFADEPFLNLSGTCKEKALPRQKKAAAADALNEPTATDPTKTTNATATEPNDHRPDTGSQEEIDTVAQRYLLAFNDTHGTRHAMTPNLKARVRACLKADPPYTADALVSAAILSWFDANDWYADKNPTYPLRFGTEGKAHLDDLLAQIVPGVRFGDKLVKLAKAHGVVAYFREKTGRPAQGSKNVETEAT
jgi:hypothetical protein